MKRTILYTLLVCLLIGCNNNRYDKDGMPVFGINIQQAQNVDISEYIDSVQFIKLQTTADNVMQYTRRAFFVNDKIVVLDGDRQFVIFDKLGNYLYKINKQGRGPEEYLAIDQGLWDPIHQYVIIYGGSKVMYYSLDGQFVKEINKIRNTARDIVNLPNGHFLCYSYDYLTSKVGKDASGLWEVDESGNFITSYFPQEKLYPVSYNLDNSSFGILDDGTICFRDNVYDNVYHFKDGQLIKYLNHEVEHYSRYRLPGITYTEERYISSETSQEKGNYIFTQWHIHNPPKTENPRNATFYSIYSKKKQKNILVYPRDNFWAKHKVVKPNGLDFVYNNLPNVLLTSLSGNAILDYLNDEQASPEIKAKLKPLLAGMDESQISEMNSVFQLLYVK